MGFLALASCVTLLTGCESDALWGLGGKWNQFVDWGKGLLGLKKDEKQQKEDEDKQDDQNGEEGGETPAPVVPTMTVAELPARLDCGEPLDLGEYVTLTNATDFQVVLSSESAELASVEGHVLTATGEGTISFTIQCGELSQECSIVGYRSSREALIEYFEGVGKEYSVVIYEPAFDDQDQFTGFEMADVLYHSENYILTLTTWDSDDEGNPIPGGFLKFGAEAEECFAFSISGEGENEAVVLADEYPLMLMDYYNSDFDVDFSAASYEADPDSGEDFYVISGDDAAYFAENSLFLPNGNYGSYPVERVEFNIYNEAEEGQPESLAVDAYVYITYEGELTIVEVATLYVDEASVGYPLLDAYCVPENKPEGVDYWEYFGANAPLGSFFLGGETSMYGYDGLISVTYGWADDEGNAIATPSDVDQTYFVYCPIGQQLMYTSENSVWHMRDVLDPDTGELLGREPDSGRMFVAGEGEAPGVVYNIFPTDDGYYAEEDTEHGVWGDPSLTFEALKDRANYAPGYIASAQDLFEEVPAATEGEEPTQEYYATVFTFKQGKVGGLLDAVIASTDELSILGQIIDIYNSYGLDVKSYFTGSLIIYPYDGLVGLTLSFGWDDNVNYTVSFTSMANPSAASACESYAAYMASNVIGA